MRMVIGAIPLPITPKTTGSSVRIRRCTDSETRELVGKVLYAAPVKCTSPPGSQIEGACLICLEGQRDDLDGEQLAELERRSGALKWILVACFGYQGFGNAKFGRIECHEQIKSYDSSYYETQLIRAVESVLSPFGWDRSKIRRELSETRVPELTAFTSSREN